MARRVTAIFDSRDAAERAAAALVDMGADRSQISTLARGDDRFMDTTSDRDSRPHTDVVEPAREVGDAGAPLTTTDEHEAARDAAAGAAIGAVVGIAAGAAALFVPGFGPILAAGPLAWAIGGAAGTAAAGAVVGGVYGGLHDLGIEESHARRYEERIRGGGVLLTALVPMMDEQRARDVLNDYGAHDITFSEDMSSAAARADFPAGEAALSNPVYQPSSSMNQPLTTPGAAATYPTSTAPGADIPAASWSGAESNIARGEAKQAEGEWRDRAADRTASPLDDLAAKGEKVEGKLQEEYGEEEEEIDSRVR